MQSQDMEQTKPYPNNVRYCIKRQGYTIQEVADEAGIPRRTLTNYVSGSVPIPRQSLEKIAHVIGCDIEELLQPSEDEGYIPEQNDSSRRQFLRQMLGVTSAAFLMTSQELLNQSPWERLSMALAKPTNIDEITINNLEVITKNYWQLSTSITSRDLLGGVLGHLQTITTLLQGPLVPTTRNHLCSIAGEIAQIAGKISFDMNDYVAAQGYYKVSAEAAQEAENHALYAVALGRMSFLPVYNGQAKEALTFLKKSQRLATHRATTTTQAWLAVVEAEAQANIKDTTSCLKALERAEYAVNSVTPEEDPYWTGFDHSRLAGYKGVCYVRLQQPEPAIQALNEALLHLKPSSIRRRATILTDLATAYLQQEEIEEGCKLASQALTLAVQTKSAMVLKRIHNFHQQLEPWKDEQTVKDLDEQLLFS